MIILEKAIKSLKHFVSISSFWGIGTVEANQRKDCKEHKTKNCTRKEPLSGIPFLYY